MSSSVISGTAHKNGGTAETGRQGKSDMLQVAEKPEKAKLLTKVGSEFITASPDKKAAEWLEGHIAKSQDKITTVVADLTPALARILLNRNDGNRKIGEKIADTYSRDMINGGWLFNGEPIIISKDGHLNDGQHRCAAVIKADTAISVIMVFGIERETQTTLDQGKMRSVGDYLSMRGYVNAVRIGAAANFALQAKRIGRISYGGSGRSTKSEILAFVDSTPDIVTSVEVCERKGADAVGGRALIAFIHSLLSGGQISCGAMSNIRTSGPPTLSSAGWMTPPSSKISVSHCGQNIKLIWPNSKRRKHKPSRTHSLPSTQLSVLLRQAGQG